MNGEGSAYLRHPLHKVAKYIGFFQERATLHLSADALEGSFLLKRFKRKGDDTIDEGLHSFPFWGIGGEDSSFMEDLFFKRGLEGEAPMGGGWLEELKEPSVHLFI